MKVNLIYLRLNFRGIFVSNLKWLPNIVNINRFQNINALVEYLYKIFENDFKSDFAAKFENRKIEINNLPLHIRCEKLLDKGLNCNNKYKCSNCPYIDKEDIFNHITCRELTGDIRTPGIFEEERAIRLPWIKPVIENCNKEHPSIKYYETIVKNEKRKCFWLEVEKFLVIITEDKQKRLYLTSAYYLYNRKTSDRPRRDYKKYCKKMKKDATN